MNEFNEFSLNFKSSLNDIPYLLFLDLFNYTKTPIS